MTFNGSHFFEVIEGHGGSWNYYFTEGVSKLFGSGVLVPYLLVVGWCMLGLRARTRFQKVYLMAAVAFVYGFYSLAATKMLAFPLIVFPLLMLGLAALLDGVYTYVAQQWKRGRWMVQVVGVLAMGMILYGFLNIPELTRRHSAASSWWRMKVEEDMRIREAVAQLPPGAILFGAKTHDNDHIYSYIIFMFYGDGLTAVANMPDAHQLSQLRAQDISGYYVYRDQQILFESIE